MCKNEGAYVMTKREDDISKLKRCATAAFIGTRKHTRTRRWRKGKQRGSAKQGARPGQGGGKRACNSELGQAGQTDPNKTWTRPGQGAAKQTPTKPGQGPTQGPQQRSGQGLDKPRKKTPRAWPQLSWPAISFESCLGNKRRTQGSPGHQQEGTKRTSSPAWPEDSRRTPGGQEGNNSTEHTFRGEPRDCRCLLSQGRTPTVNFLGQSLQELGTPQTSLNQVWH